MLPPILIPTATWTFLALMSRARTSGIETWVTGSLNEVASCRVREWACGRRLWEILPWAVAAEKADLNSDGFLDLVLTRRTDEDLVLLGQASGGFRESAASLGMHTSYHLVLADLNADSHIDVYVCGGASEPDVIYWNRGDATFSFLINQTLQPPPK